MAPPPIASVNPATEEQFAEFPAQSVDEVDRALTQNRAAVAEWKKVAPEERASFLRRAAQILREDRAELARLITLEMGKPILEAEAEIDKSAWCCEYYAECGPDGLARESVESGADSSYIRFDPLGTVLAVMPWNYPLWQVFRFAPPTLLAGNGIVLKHASNVPQCAQAIARIWERAGVPTGLFTTLLVESSAVASLIADRRIDAVTLTGSTEVGAEVAAIAGRNLKPQVLELGGSDPFIILSDADIQAAAVAAAAARTHNTGQSCISAKRFIVEASVEQEFTHAFATAMDALVMGDPQNRDVQVGPLARASIRSDLLNQIERSVGEGARVVTGGETPEGRGHFLRPAILDRVTPEMTVAREETFGPVAAVISVADAADAVRVANATPFGLGAAVWTGDLARAELLTQDIEAGAVFINGVVASDPRLPFGGIKDSGYGRELGIYGLRQFTNVKSVWIGPARKH